MTKKSRFFTWLSVIAEFLAGMRHPQYRDRRHISLIGCCVCFKKDDN
jgi:hypothetical protein